MRSETAIRNELDKIVSQLKSLSEEERYSAAAKRLQRHAQSLLWVLESDTVATLHMSDETLELLRCVG